MITRGLFHDISSFDGDLIHTIKPHLKNKWIAF